MKRITEWMAQLDEKRAIAIGVASALVALSLDAAVGHFAGRAGAHPAQWLSVTLGPAASAMVLAFAIPKLDAARFRRAMLVIGGIVAALGAAGTAFHLRSLLTLLGEHPFGVQGLEIALAEGPPMFAPGGFFGLGVVLAALGSTQLVVRFRGRGAGVPFTELSATAHGPQLPHLSEFDRGVDLGLLDPFLAERVVDRAAATARLDLDLRRPILPQPTLGVRRAGRAPSERRKAS